MARIEIRCGPNTISLEEVDEFDFIDADRTLYIDDSGDAGRYRPNASVMFVAAGSPPTTLHVLAYGAPTTLGDHSVVCVNDRVVAIIGSFALCLTPDLQTLIWQRRCDSASCFGVYALPGERELVVHGELTISKLTVRGDIVWQTAGQDAFTGPLSLTSTTAWATDSNGTGYMIGLNDGNTTVIPSDMQS